DDVQRASVGISDSGACASRLGDHEAHRGGLPLPRHPLALAAALGREKVLPVATDLITQFNPAVPDHDAAVRALELIATEVAPALGWKPARPDEPASAEPAPASASAGVLR
ncbi:LLM class flavin-dependent oxidoreductase, partial [Streptomyces sp. NPDC058398]